MAELTIDAVVFDVLGTLVDEPAGLRTGIRALTPSASPSASASASPSPSLDDSGTERLLLLWQRHIEREQGRIVDGDRPYLPSDALDREAAEIVARAAGAKNPAAVDPAAVDPAAVADPDAVESLARAARRLPPWPDTVAGLARLAERFPLIGLSNASRTALLELNAHAGLRWHQALSAEDARTYKPDPEVYRLAVTVAGVPPERLLMVAAHAWDLRGAQALGLRTAYVARPVGDPPTSSDRFDLYAEDLADLADQLGVS
ncbi:haloacid dehalogenase type II [Streptomyces filamentosus]|uniref:Haloacid dehalogenase type II n=3 Tax=Streptomyces TaxID=1883 RepID=A0ABY4USP3_STRFL|nr:MULTISPECIES: haloacid dehalogenase type II [Streptomyces]EFE77231.1 2-haloalkanoic acid dehalogenase [Streptomyces filamentosus NRRL 15998]EWS94184.1 haloacid dehalogenase, type II [Streptomyces filamentosus NRRL 11379]MYR81174.1 haloacid dehalogenase type II [Streptomyces sp. SID5466]USC47340.1 haloacid dehalogenase type II [Streptomyces filamentosus]